MKSVNDVVALFQEEWVADVKRSYFIKSVITPKWRDIFGKLAPEFIFDHVRYRQLYIGTINPIWKSEIKYHESLIIERINQLIPKKLYLKGIRVFLVSASTKVSEKKEKKLNKVSSDSLESRVKVENNRKRKQGYLVCIKCQKVLTLNKQCDFCRLQ